MSYYLLLRPDGSATYGDPPDGAPFFLAVRDLMPELYPDGPGMPGRPGAGTQGMGRFRLWFPDTMSPKTGLPDNLLANFLIPRLGYHDQAGGSIVAWRGPVLIAMEEVRDTSSAEGLRDGMPPFPGEVLETLDELLAEAGVTPTRGQAPAAANGGGAR